MPDVRPPAAPTPCAHPRRDRAEETEEVYWFGVRVEAWTLERCSRCGVELVRAPGLPDDGDGVGTG